MERANDERNERNKANNVCFSGVNAEKDELLCAVCTESIDEERAYFDSCYQPLCAECLLELHKL